MWAIIVVKASLIKKRPNISLETALRGAARF